MISKKRILKAIAALGKKLGRPPSVLLFVSCCGISRQSVQRFFPRWNDAVSAAGLQPHTLNARVEDRALLEDWGQAVRKNRGVPARRAYMRDGKYDRSTMERRFGSWTAMPQAFRNFALHNQEWKDVLDLLPAPGPASGPPRGPRGPRSKAGRQLPNNHSAFALPLEKTLHPQAHLQLRDRPSLGNPTPFRWLRYEPVNEQGVVLLFGMLAKELGYMIETVQTGFPDCEALRQIGPERWQRVRIEFEFESRNFREHGHAATGCDVIICWRHNWEECPEHIEVVELSRIIQSLAG
jgi:hypothetical protein